MMIFHFENLESKGSGVTDGYSQAMDEMLKRIKTGAALRPTARPPKNPASLDTDRDSGRELGMLELKKMLGKMKKMTTGSSSPAVSAREDSSELAKAFKKRNKSSSSEVKEADSNDCEQDQNRLPDIPETKIEQEERKEADTSAPKQEQSKPVPRRRTFSKSASEAPVEDKACVEQQQPQLPSD